MELEDTKKPEKSGGGTQYKYFYNKVCGLEEYAPNGKKAQYAQTKWKFFLDAPFEISHACCTVMKKSPIHSYNKEKGMVGMTAQMASESRLRTQQWLKSGCNAFDNKNPVSNPMSFWTENDVLTYVLQNNIELASVYGSVVKDYAAMGTADNQMTLDDVLLDTQSGIFDKSVPLLKTTGAERTGCWACGFGLHLEKPQCENRLFKAIEYSNPSIVNALLKGGHFAKDGLWKPYKGMGYWFVLEWCNVHGNMNYQYPNRESYLKEYMTKETEKYLV